MQNYKTLTQSGIIAIPLRNKVEANLGNLHPNFLIFESQFGKSKSESIDIVTGEPKLVDCVQTQYKIVYREILEATLQKPEEFIERVLLPGEILAMPVEMLPLIFTHQSIKENLAIVNLALSRFSFRGVLQNLVLEVDEQALDEIIELETAE